MKIDLYENYQGGDASKIRTSYQDEDGNNIEDLDYLKNEWKHQANNQHGSEEIDMGSGSGGRAEGGFNFGSLEERMFMQNKVQFTAVGLANGGAVSKIMTNSSPTGGLMN